MFSAGTFQQFTGCVQNTRQQGVTPGSVICGSKKKQDAKGRLKAGRKRLADVIAELQTSATLDAGLLRRRLEEVDSALGGMEEPCPSSSSSSSSDEEDEMMQGRTAVATASPAAEPEMAPRSNAVPMQLAGKAKAVVPACVVSTTELNALVASLAPDSVVRVCQGKACLRADSASLLADLQQHSGAADMQVTSLPCKCLDQCAKRAVNVEVTEGAQKRLVKLSAMELARV